jgi:hypothetical protein
MRIVNVFSDRIWNLPIVLGQEMIRHRLASTTNDRGGWDYYISCLKGVEHDISDYAWSRSHKRATCPKCMVYDYPTNIARANIVKQLKQNPEFRTFLRKHKILTRFIDNCIKQRLKTILINDPIRNNIVWDKSNEGYNFWQGVSNQWEKENQ